MIRLCLLVLFFLFNIAFPVLSYADNVVLKAGVSLDAIVPDVFFGSWRVKSAIIESDSSGFFKQNNVDLWNIFKNDDVITLENPFSGARASITLREVKDNKVVFEKVGFYNNQKLIDIVELYLDKNSFKGYNYIKLITISDVDGHILKTINAKYSLYGDKISGENVIIEE